MLRSKEAAGCMDIRGKKMDPSGGNRKRPMNKI